MMGDILQHNTSKGETQTTTPIASLHKGKHDKHTYRQLSPNLLPAKTKRLQKK